MISYNPLWETMKKKQISQYRLLKSGIDNKTLDSLKKGKNITLLTLEKLCRILECTPNDIIEFNRFTRTAQKLRIYNTSDWKLHNIFKLTRKLFG